jgi:membrane protein required for colicin V production
MTAFDYAVLTVLGMSVLLGLWRGVVSEILALAAWVVAFLVARAEAAEVANWLAPRLAEPPCGWRRRMCWWWLRFWRCFRVARLVLKLLLKAVGLGLLDRMLGAAFGALRGLLVVLVAVMVAGMTPLPKMEWWREARLAPPLETAVLQPNPGCRRMRQNGFGIDRGRSCVEFWVWWRPRR